MSKYLIFILVLVLVACGEEKPAAPPTLDPQSEAGKGASVFRTHCAACHAVGGERVVVGPALSGIASRAGERVAGQSAEDYLYESILDPNKFVVEGFVAGSMQQNFGSVLTSEEINQVLAYLLTLN